MLKISTSAEIKIGSGGNFRKTEQRGDRLVRFWKIGFSKTAFIWEKPIFRKMSENVANFRIVSDFCDFAVHILK